MKKLLQIFLIIALLTQSSAPMALLPVYAAGSTTIQGDYASLTVTNNGAGTATSGEAPVTIHATCNLSSSYPASTRFPGTNPLYLRISCDGGRNHTAFSPGSSASVSRTCTFVNPGSPIINCHVSSSEQ